MAQPKIDGAGHGIPRMVYGSDGADHYEVYADSEGVLRVRASDGDKIFSFESVLYGRKDTTATAINDYAAGDPVPAGKVWKITTISISDFTTLCTEFEVYIKDDGTRHMIEDVDNGISLTVYTVVKGEWYMAEGDTISVRFQGSQIDDSLIVRWAGVQMNAP